VNLNTVELANIFSVILDNCCSNPTEDGWKEISIETHCVAWIITAKKENGKWIILDVKSEDC
jgi:hypothetical protein